MEVVSMLEVANAHRDITESVYAKITTRWRDIDHVLPPRPSMVAITQFAGRVVGDSAVASEHTYRGFGGC